MNRLVLLGILALTLTSVYQADAKGLRLEEVVRALDALYKRQPTGSKPSGSPPPSHKPTGSPPPSHKPTGSPPPSHKPSGSPPPSHKPTGSPPPHTTPGFDFRSLTATPTSGIYGTDWPGSGSGSGSWEGGACIDTWSIFYMLQEVRDRMFLHDLRTVTGSFNGICVDIFEWLDHHTMEYEEATDSDGDFKKRSTKLDGVKRNLKKLQSRMEKRSGSFDDDEGYYGEQQMNDEDIFWHRIFMSCYLWLNLSNETMYYEK